MNKMVMAVIPRDEAERVLRGLVAAGYTATVSLSRGGVLRQAQQMLFTAVDAANLDEVLAIIRANCREQVEIDIEEMDDETVEPAPVTAEFGGAVVFVWDLEHFEVY